MKHLAGIIPVVVTPFEADGRIDHGSLERLVEDYCAGGISGMIVPAVASEVEKLSEAERLDLVQRVVEVTAGRVPVVGGVIEPSASEAARAVEHLLAAGCQYILCRAPSDVAGDWNRAMTYFSQVAATGVEYLVIQDLSWGDFGLEVDLICALRERIPAFQCVKIEVARTGYKATVLRERTGGALQVWSGWAMPQMMEALDRGIHGFNPSAFHRPYVSVVQRYLAGDRARASALFEATLPYLAWSRQHFDVNLHLLKRFCVRKGLFRSAHLRAPFIPWDDFHERYAGELIDRMLSWETLGPGNQAT
jgi:dihydrodipicolinate synthase/N-acetylneuraminate lyase